MHFLTRILENVKKHINERSAQNFTELPPGAKKGLSKYLKQDEEIMFVVRNFRAMYKAPRWIDSNTFFNSWFILTNRRIIIAKNSPSFKRFRDISLETISEIDHEKESSDYRLTISSPGKVDMIEFLRESIAYCEGLEQKLNEAFEKARQSEFAHRTVDSVFCNECGSKVSVQSKFCSECGLKL